MMQKTLGANGWEVSIPPNKVPYILAQSAVQVILVPNGTVATNGAITLGTALPMIYSGGAWIRLPAGAVVGGAAGLYWCIFSSTTVGAVKTNFSDPALEFTPTIPIGTLVAAVGSNAAYTQTTAADITLVNTTLLGGALGSTGGLRVTPIFSNNNTAGLKTYGVRLAGIGLTGTATTVITQMPQLRLFNRGSPSVQVFNPSFTVGYGPSASAVTPGSVNTAVDQPITLTGQLAAATDYIIMEAFTIEVLPA